MPRFSANLKNIPKGKIFACIAVIAFMVMMLAKPEYYLNSARRGLTLFATSVLPSLFPFYFFSLLLTYIGAAKTVSEMFRRPVKLLYNAPKESAYVLILSMLSGYPVGASMTAELYSAGVINGREAKAIAAFASTSGPVFMLGTVGSAIFGDVRVGAIVLGAHYVAAILNGLIYRVRGTNSTNSHSWSIFRKKEPDRNKQKNSYANNNAEIARSEAARANTDSPAPSERAGQGRQEFSRTSLLSVNDPRKSLSDDVMRSSESAGSLDKIMSQTISNATLSMLYVGGYIVICGMLTDTVALFNADSVFSAIFGEEISQVLIALIYGLIEMTRGSIACAECELTQLGVALCAGIVSFGGLSVTLQNYTFLSKCDIKFHEVVIRKLTQSVITFVLAYCFTFLL